MTLASTVIVLNQHLPGYLDMRFKPLISPGLSRNVLCFIPLLIPVERSYKSLTRVYDFLRRAFNFMSILRMLEHYRSNYNRAAVARKKQCPSPWLLSIIILECYLHTFLYKIYINNSFVYVIHSEWLYGELILYHGTIMKYKTSRIIDANYYANEFPLLLKTIYIKDRITE